jgi:hypothetical protein
MLKSGAGWLGYNKNQVVPALQMAVFVAAFRESHTRTHLAFHLLENRNFGSA